MIELTEVYGSAGAPSVGIKIHHLMMTTVLAPCFDEMFNQTFNSVNKHKSPHNTYRDANLGNFA